MAHRSDISNDPYSGFRRLYEQSPSKTLWFTTATSNFATKFEKSVRTTYGGIYQCILEPPSSNLDDFSDADESRESCHFANVLGDWTTFEGARHHEFIVRNLQFDLSSLRSSKPSESKNYLYATTHSDFVATQTVIENNPDIDDDQPMPVVHARTMPDWEIIRAELPNENDFEGTVLNDDGTLRFESVFRINQTIDTWNEYDFDCCVQNDRMDNGPWWGSKNYEDVQHAYKQTRTRGFVVDEHTGDVFVSWEGFYKNCESLANKYASGPLSKMKWTIGVSRLRMEDPNCVFMDRNTDDDIFGCEARRHFPRCTEPVVIAFQRSLGRQLVLPYGGFLVVPAETLGGGTARRNFLLTVLENTELSKTPDKISASVWSVVEGRGVDAGIPHNDTAQQMASSMVDGSFWETDAWDGGSLRLHFHHTKKKPDHLCRTVYDEGIHCQTVTTKMTSMGIPVVSSSATPFTEAFLSKEQTSMFCKSNNNDVHKVVHNYVLPAVPFVAGLDVQWHPILGTPRRIFFGCGGFGGGGATHLVGSGNFGSVERHGEQLRRVLDGAFAETALFLPRELEGTTDPRVVAAATAKKLTNTMVSEGSSSSGAFFFRAGASYVGLLVVAVAAAVALAVHYRKRRRRRRHPMTSSLSSSRFPTATMPYVELQNFDGSLGLMLD